jgi:mannose-1-phosphate guanylyltransferase/mannose-6-phosphate isomerase
LTDHLLNIFKVDTFLEKPTKTQFSKFNEMGKHYWNTGIFITRPQTLLTEISQLDRTTYDLCSQSMLRAKVIDHTIYPLLQDCSLIQEAAIDHTVMTHSHKLYTTLLNCHWSDVGTWSAVSKILPEDGDGNSCVGHVDIVDSHNCFAFSNKPRICLIGVNDLIVAGTEDAVLVMTKEQDVQLKKIVEEGHKNHIREFCEIPEQFRPWGSFRILNRSETFQIKELNVLPHKQLSLQSHQHRSERWTVLCGEAHVTLNQEVHLLKEQETIFIPKLAQHRLKNPTDGPLKLLEIQFGEKILESDIIRYQDDFHRS